MNYKTLRDFDLKGKTILLRADLNVPVQDGNVTDFTRIDRLKPTIDHLKNQAKKIIILSHYGRPKGKVDPEYSLEFLTPVLEQRWEAKIGFGSGTQEQISLLENVRFNAGEEENDKAYAKELASLGDLFVNDAFSAAHRAHASTEGITHYLPSCAGLLMEAEINALTQALEAPTKPVMAVVGGAKVSTKLSVLNNMVQKVDYLILGGGMANTFLHAQGHAIGQSLCEKDMADEAKHIMDSAQKAGCNIILPVDQVVVREFKENAPHEIISVGHITDDQESMDIGPASIQEIEKLLEGCKTVLWNGPMGVFEMKPFDNGTNKVAQKVAELTKSKKLMSVAGGGDTVSALDNAGVVDDFSYISTAGGAFLEWIEGKELPGVSALKQAASKAA
ncbi:MAG: phosphoglycerate kinase [Alphaproteobacteria bacterium]|nr:phosphoglycerate kinase [Alphaproteobacteria bacterium]